MRRNRSINFNTRKTQHYADPFRQTDRTLLYMGRCVCCRTTIYRFVDGENDPRGILGNHAADMVHAEDHGRYGIDIPACFMCMNNYTNYHYVMHAADYIWNGIRTICTVCHNYPRAFNTVVNGVCFNCKQAEYYENQKMLFAPKDPPIHLTRS